MPIATVGAARCFHLFVRPSLHYNAERSLLIELRRGGSDVHHTFFVLRLDNQERLASEGGGFHRAEGTYVVGMPCASNGKMWGTRGLDINRYLGCRTEITG